MQTHMYTNTHSSAHLCKQERDVCVSKPLRMLGEYTSAGACAHTHSPDKTMTVTNRSWTFHETPSYAFSAYNNLVNRICLNSFQSVSACLGQALC